MQEEYRVVVLVGKLNRKSHLFQLETTTRPDDLDQLALDIQTAVEEYEFDHEVESEGLYEDTNAAKLARSLQTAQANES